MIKHNLLLQMGVLILVSSGQASAATLQYPLVFRKTVANADRATTDSTVLISSLNAQFEAVGIQPFPNSIDLEDPSQARSALDRIETQFDNAIRKIKLTPAPKLSRASLAYATDRELRENRLCYKGVPSEAVSLMDDLTEIAFSPRLSTIGFRHKKSKQFGPDVSVVDIAEKLPASWKDWSEWKAQGETILYLWHEDDDKRDIQIIREALIPRCAMAGSDQ